MTRNIQQNVDDINTHKHTQNKVTEITTNKKTKTKQIYKPRQPKSANSTNLNITKLKCKFCPTTQSNDQ